MDDIDYSRKAECNVKYGQRVETSGLMNTLAVQRRHFKLFIFWLSLVAAVWANGGVSLANSPAKARSIVITPDHVPEEAEYLELLIPMPLDSPYYRSYNQDMGDETGLAEQAPIVGYIDPEGYMSYSFHMENACSNMRLEKGGHEGEFIHSYAFGEGAYAGSLTHLEYIQNNFGTIKAALLDREGNVLAVSDGVSIKTNRSEYLSGTIAYDCADGSLSPSIYKGSAGAAVIIAMFLLLILVSFIGRAVLTAAVESAVSFAFRIRPWSTVFKVNIASNIIFNLVLVLGTTVLQIPYLFFVTAGEAAVIWAEYCVYRRKLSAAGSRILAFTIAANLASLLLGICLNGWLAHIGIYGFVQLL